MKNKLNKRMQKVAESKKTVENKNLKEIISALKESSKVKFDESVDLSIKLNIDPKRTDQAVRGACVLPHGNGKTIKIAVFASGDQAKEAKAAGADFVGDDSLIDDVKAGRVHFDACIATQSLMVKISKSIAPILGKRGIMPNPKNGTVTEKITETLKDLRKGTLMFKTDKFGHINCQFAKLKFSEKEILENLKMFIEKVSSLKPVGFKKEFIKKIHLSSTMGFGVDITRKINE